MLFRSIDLFFIPTILVIVPATLILLYAKYKATQRARMRSTILEKQVFSQNMKWFPVRYCSQRHFLTIWKFFVWETSGVIFLDKNIVRFVSENQIHSDLVIDLNIPETLLKWVGMKFWPNGFLSWFSIASNSETYYFTSETGTFVFSSGKTSKDIYNRLLEHISVSKSS